MVAIPMVRIVFGFAGVSWPWLATNNLDLGLGWGFVEVLCVANLCLHRALLYMFTAVAVAITAPTAAQYICCIKNRLGTPSPIDIPPMPIPDISILVNLIVIRFNCLWIFTLTVEPFQIGSVRPVYIR